MTIEEYYIKINNCEYQLGLFNAANKETIYQLDELSSMRKKLVEMQNQIETMADAGIKAINGMVLSFAISCKKAVTLFNNSENLYKGAEYQRAYTSICSAIGKVDAQVSHLNGDIDYNNKYINYYNLEIEKCRNAIAQLEAQGGI